MPAVTGISYLQTSTIYPILQCRQLRSTFAAHGARLGCGFGGLEHNGKSLNRLNIFSSGVHREKKVNDQTEDNDKKNDHTGSDYPDGADNLRGRGRRGGWCDG